MNYKGEFPVGTKVVGCNFAYDVKLNGMYGEILEGLRQRFAFHLGTWAFETNVMYKVRWADGEVNAIKHTNLYRRLPDAETLGWAQAKVAKLLFPMPLLPK